MSIDNLGPLGGHPTPERQDEPPAGWVKMPRGLVGRVSSTAVYVALALGEYANASGECFPTYKTLGDKLGLHRNTVRRAVTELVEAGEVKVEHRRRTAGKGGEVAPGSKPSTSNLITLLWMVERCTTSSAVSGGGAPPVVQGGAPPTRDRTRTTGTKKTTTTERRVVDLKDEKQQRTRQKVLRSLARRETARAEDEGRIRDDPKAYLAVTLRNMKQDMENDPERRIEIDKYLEQFPDLDAEDVAEKIDADRPAVNVELTKRARPAAEDQSADGWEKRVAAQGIYAEQLRDLDLAVGGAP